MTTFDRSHISFEQAEGIEPLPTQLALKEVSKVLRARLWEAVFGRIQSEQKRQSLHTTLGTSWKSIFRKYWIERLGRFSDSVGDQVQDLVGEMRPVFEKGTYAECLGLVEWLTRHCSDSSLAGSFAKLLVAERCAYRLIDNCIVPIASEHEGKAVHSALDSLKIPGLGGARGHLLKAGSLLTAGDYADSIRESIRAVESVARSLTGETSLQKALAELSKKHPIHPALRNGFNNIYGYTSDENGIRHPMVGDGEANVGEVEAMFMLGSCAAFVTYLVNAARGHEK